MDERGAAEADSFIEEISPSDDTMQATTTKNKSGSVLNESASTASGIIYGVEDRPPWASVAFMGIQHYSISFGGCFALPLIVAGPLCFDLDRSLLNQLISTSFFISGITTLLQTFLGTRLPIIQGPSAAFIVPAMVLFSMQGQCPQPLTSNSTVEERRFANEVALRRMQELQGSICLASLVQFLFGFTGLVGILLRFIRPITIATTLLLIGIPILPLASDASGTHWGVSGLCMFLVILFSQFLDKYDIPLFKEKRLALFTFFPILLAVSISWIVCLILTAAGAFPDDPTEYGYKARTDIYNAAIKDAPWFRFPYPDYPSDSSTMDFTDVLDEKELERSKEYRCRVCKERMKSLTKLRDHLRCKHKAERFACQMCTYSSDRKGNLIRHIETTHQKKRSSKDKAVAGTSGGSSSKDRTPGREEPRDKTKTTPKVERKVLPQYAPVLSELLSQSPSECRLKTSVEGTSPQSPEKREIPRQSPKEIRNELGNQKGLPDPRMFQRHTLDGWMTEIGQTMEKARRQASKLPTGDTSCEWKLVRMTERKRYVVTTETAIKDGFYYRRVREEHLE